MNMAKSKWGFSKKSVKNLIGFGENVFILRKFVGQETKITGSLKRRKERKEKRRRIKNKD